MSINSHFFLRRKKLQKGLIKQAFHQGILLTTWKNGFGRVLAIFTFFMILQQTQPSGSIAGIRFCKAYPETCVIPDKKTAYLRRG